MNPPKLTIATFVEPSFGQNAYVVSTAAEGGRIGWIIDPGFSPQVDELLAHARDQGIRIERIVITHGHLDHIAGVDAARRAHPAARVAMPVEEWGSLGSAEENLSAALGMDLTQTTRADEDLPPGGELSLGPLSWRILDVSGHSPAGRALYCPQAGVVFSGDALFAGSIGRTDFPGADAPRLLRNIRTHLFQLPPETVVYAGHGPPTTIENERKFNPFVSD
ncbi:MAG: MBL fold metallo-hydrolase [Phycisphaerae bacterium]|jgi:glyoxylase-like metal-dependent hydrolase (beta-lactamase superfamily II)